MIFGFLNRVYDKAETSAKRKAAEVPEEEVQEKAALLKKEEIIVLSFTDSTPKNYLNIELAGLEKKCVYLP